MSAILKPHAVVEILGEPRKVAVKLDHIEITYWSVPAKMKSHKGKTYQSAVTFESLEDAIELSIGDTFLR